MSSVGNAINDLEAQVEKISQAVEILRGLNQETNKTDKAQAVLPKYVGKNTPAGSYQAAGQRRKISASARKRISDAQRERWAKIHALQERSSRAA